MKTDSEWRYWFKSYFQDENPHAWADENRRELIDAAWEIAAALAFVGFVLWLSYWPHGA